MAKAKKKLSEIQKQLKSKQLRQELAKGASDPSAYKKSLQKLTKEQAERFAASRQSKVDQIINDYLQKLKEPNFTLKPKDVYELAREAKENPPIDVAKTRASMAAQRNPLVPYEAPGLPSVIESTPAAAKEAADVIELPESSVKKVTETPNFTTKPQDVYSMAREAAENPPIDADKIRAHVAAQKNPLVPYERSGLPATITRAASNADNIDLSKVKPIYSNMAEELAAKLGNLSGSAKEKLFETFPRLRAAMTLGAEQAMESASKVASPVMKAAGPVAAAYSMAEGSKAGGELFGDYDNLSTRQKAGKLSKMFGGGAMAASAPMAAMGAPLFIPSAGTSELPAAVTALVGTGLYSLGEYLDQPDAPATPPTPSTPVEEKKVEPLPYKNIVKDLSDEELQQILDYQSSPSYYQEPTGEFKAPSVDEVKRKAFEVAKKLNLNPAYFLSQIEQESSFNPLAVSKTGAKGLGQMFPAAFLDAKKMDKEGVLKDLNYRDMIKPENWDKQLYAAGLYNKWIDTHMTKGAGEEARLKWYAGGSNPEKAKEQGTDVDEYVKSINKRLNRNQQWIDNEYNKKPSDEATTEARQVDRAPAGDSTSEIFDATENLKFQDLGGEDSTIKTPMSLNEKQQQILDWLRKDTKNTNMAGEGPIVYAPYANTEEGAKNYSQALTDSDRLMNLKRRYDELKNSKNPKIYKEGAEPYLFGGSKLTKEDELPVDEDKLFNPSYSEEKEEVEIPRDVMEKAMWKGVPFSRPDLSQLEGKNIKLAEEQSASLPVSAGQKPVSPDVSVPATPASSISAPTTTESVPVKQMMGSKEMMPLLLQALKSKGDVEGRAAILRGLNQAMHGAMEAKGKVKLENISDKLIEGQEKLAGESLKDLSAEIEMNKFSEENDPRSEKAESYRNFLNTTFNIDPQSIKNLSLKEMKDLTTPLAAMTKAKAEYKREEIEKADKEVDKFKDKISAAFDQTARSNIGKTASIIFQADRMYQVTGRDPSKFDELTGSQIFELIGAMDSMINTQSTIAGRKHLADTISTYRQNLTRFAEKTGNRPLGAKAGDFVRSMYKTINTERKLAEKRVNQYFDAHYVGVSDKTKQLRDPKLKEIMAAFAKGFMDEVIYDKDTEKGIANFMRVNKIENREEAVEILKKQGLIKQ